MNLDVLLLKQSFNNYDDKDSFSNYESKAKEYYKKYKKIKDKQKSNNSSNNEIPLSQIINENSSPYREKLKDEVKKWFFSLPIERRIKIATVECEWICNIIYQMYLYASQDPSIVFKPKDIFLPKLTNDSSEKKSEIETTSVLLNRIELEDEIIYPPNTPTRAGVNTITISKTKNHKNQVTTQTVRYSQQGDSYFIKDNISDYFDFHSNKLYSTQDFLTRTPNQVLDDIKFFSVHHRYHPDCMTLKPTFLLNESMFDNYFKMSGNKNYFQYLIEPFYDENNKVYSFMMPSWMNTNEYFSVINYIFAFFEQTILIKYLLNYSPNAKKNKNQDIIHSLIDETKLSSFFLNRKNVILYLNNNFNAVSRPSIFDQKINIREVYTSITCDKERMNSLDEWRKIMCHISYSSFSTTMKNHYNKDLNAGQIKEKIEELFLKNGNITFVDQLIYQTVFELWKMESFVKQSIYERFITLNSDKNASDLLELVESEKTSKSKKKKKNENNSNSEFNNYINVYKKIDPEYEIYLAYFIKTCHNDGYQMCKKINNASNKNKVINEPQIIKQFIKKEILGDIINNVLLTQIDEPDKPVNFFNDINNDASKDLNHLLNEDEDVQISTKSNIPKEKPKEESPKKEETQKEEKKVELILGNEINKKNKKKEKEDESLGTITISTETSNSITVTKPKKEKKKKEQTFFLYDTQKKKKTKKSENKHPNKAKKPFPYFSSKDSPLKFFEKLHNDILTYDNNITEILSLSQNIKEFVIHFIENIIRETFPKEEDYSLDIYGSFATGLMIEASDIDIKVRLNTEDKEELEKLFFLLASNLKEKNKFELINPISTASVPVIKLVINPEEFISGEESLENDFQLLKNSDIYKNFKFNYEEINKIKIDITFIASTNIEKNEKVSSVDFAKDKSKLYPEVKLILRVLKRYFYTQKMNSAFNGGLSSYNLFLLILSFAQYKKYQNSNKTIKNFNLGSFLYELVNFFGTYYNFRNYKIDINYAYQYVPLNSNDGYQTNSVVIIDPLSGLNASKSSYRIEDIQRTFFDAFNYLVQMKKEYEGEPEKDNKNYIYGMYGK